MLGVLTGIVVIALGGPAAAALCEKCRDGMYIVSIGKCTSCGGPTASGAFKLCKKCSAKLRKCQHCLARLDGPRKPPPRKKPPRPKPIDPKKPATYFFRNWKYRHDIAQPGTRSEGRWGRLLYNNRRVPIPEINDYHNTPWGPMYWVGVPKTSFGRHGWMPRPSARIQRKGKLLSVPETEPKPIELTEADNDKTVTAAVGKPIVIRTAGNPTTGYRWQTAQLAGDAVEQLGEPSYATRPHAPGLLGVGGTFTFTFKAVKPGKTTVKLVYARPWEKNKPPAKTFTVTINVKAD